MYGLFIALCNFTHTYLLKVKGAQNQQKKDETLFTLIDSRSFGFGFAFLKYPFSPSTFWSVCIILPSLFAFSFQVLSMFCLIAYWFIAHIALNGRSTFTAVHSVHSDALCVKLTSRATSGLMPRGWEATASVCCLWIVVKHSMSERPASWRSGSVPTRHRRSGMRTRKSLLAPLRRRRLSRWTCVPRASSVPSTGKLAVLWIEKRKDSRRKERTA